MATVNEKMTAIADAIRDKTGGADKLGLDGMAEGVNDVYDAGKTQGFNEGCDIGYNNGKAEGIAEGYNTGYTEGETAGIAAGKESERKNFWNQYQSGGGRTLWQYAFYDWIWQDSIYNPIYDMKVTNALCMFTSSYITNTKVAINITASGEAYRTFYNCTKLHTIPKLGVVEGLTYSEAFYNCTALKNIVIEGVIGNSFNIRWSPLTKESIASIINALSDTATGKTLSLKKTAVNTAFGIDVDDEATYPEGTEFYELRHSKDNWTFSYV